MRNLYNIVLFTIKPFHNQSTSIWPIVRTLITEIVIAVTPQKLNYREANKYPIMLYLS